MKAVPTRSRQDIRGRIAYMRKKIKCPDDIRKKVIRDKKYIFWTKKEQEQLNKAVLLHDLDYKKLQKAVPTKTKTQI